MEYFWSLVNNIIDSTLNGIWNDVKPPLIRCGLFVLIFAVSYWIVNKIWIFNFSRKVVVGISLVVTLLGFRIMSPVVDIIF